jgi:uncharacterized protein (TIGR03437 family)
VELDYFSSSLVTEQLTCAGSVQTSQAETRLDNNAATASDRPPPVTRVLVSTGLSGVAFQRDDWPVLFRTGTGITLAVARNGQVKIRFPSPQEVTLGRPLVFQSWNDGSTENPRTFSVADRDALMVSARMDLFAAPYVNVATGLVNGATYRPGPISPGEIVTLFGFNLGPVPLQTAQIGSDGRLTRELGGVKVLFDGQPAPLIYVGSQQTSVVVPYGVRDKSSVKLRIENQGRASGEADVAVAESSAGLFTAAASGAGQAAALNQNGSVNSKENPVARGEVVVLYGTGEGVLNPISEDGSIAASPLPVPVLPVSVNVGGQQAEVLYAGPAPGLVLGLLQINARVPASISPGNHVPVTVKVGNSTSPSGVTLAIR